MKQNPVTSLPQLIGTYRAAHTECSRAVSDAIPVVTNQVLHLLRGEKTRQAEALADSFTGVVRAFALDSFRQGLKNPIEMLPVLGNAMTEDAIEALRLNLAGLESAEAIAIGEIVDAVLPEMRAIAAKHSDQESFVRDARKHLFERREFSSADGISELVLLVAYGASAKVHFKDSGARPESSAEEP